MPELPTRPVPTAQRPLLGLHVLLVEDSRVAGAAIRMMCLRSGARLRRAATLRDADRHLAAWAPHVAIVDMGLPDGSGADLIERLHLARPRTEAVLGLSADPDAEDAARAAGADGFLAKPLRSMAAFQQAVIAPLPEVLRPPPGPRLLGAETGPAPDPDALRDDFEHAAALLGAQDAHLGYVTGFLAGIAASAGDEELARAVRDHPDGTAATAARLSALVGARLDARAPSDCGAH